MDYYVAAYVRPSCHDEELSRSLIWHGGTGEWEVIRKGKQAFSTVAALIRIRFIAHLDLYWVITDFHV